jgi:ribonuclease HI
MAIKSRKYYVVWKGVTPGIYDNWEQCRAQVEGFEKAFYKSFDTEEDAKRAFSGNMWQYLKTKKNASTPEESGAGPVWESLSVDAACAGNPGVMEYQCVHTTTKKQIFHQGPFPDATNNIGEFLALVHVLAMLQQRKTKIPVYSDSRTAMAWVRNKKAKTLLKPTPHNAEVFELIERAENWLKNNPVDIPILKWDTKKWGEIPADFGRKG